MEKNEDSNSLAITIARIEEKLNGWIYNGEVYRQNVQNSLCDLKEGVSEVKKKLYSLPCEKRFGWYNAINRQLFVLWGFVVAIIIAIVSEVVRRK